MSVAARRFILRACSSRNPCIPLSVEQDVISSAPISISSKSSSSRSSASSCGALRTGTSITLRPIAEEDRSIGGTSDANIQNNGSNLRNFHQRSSTLHPQVGILSNGAARRRQESKSHHQQQKRWMGHSVKIVLKEDMPNGKGFAGDIVSVKAGYARNYLVPKKIAFYATEENIAKYASSKALDEKASPSEDEVKSTEREASAEKTAAMILRKYLKEKELKIWRKADKTGRCHPGVVTAANIRQKLSKQLKIDLEDHEKVRLSPDAINYDELLGAAEFAASQGDSDIGALDALVKPEDLGKPLEDIEPCNTEIKQVGDYVAKIYLDGGYCVPLHVKVIRKVY